MSQSLQVVFVTPSISRCSGGIFEIERCLGKALARIPRTEVFVFGGEDRFTQEDVSAWAPLKPAVFPILGPLSFGYSPSMKRALRLQAGDLAHLHALWMYTSVVTADWARNTHRPYFITPNGMLEPWALKNSALKKRVAAMLYERRTLQNASCLQANTEKEAADIRSFGLKNPICVIPNGVDLPDAERGDHSSVISDQLSVTRQLRSGGCKVLLFLGRIHPKKGLVNLLGAWAAITRRQSQVISHQSADWTLAIAGWDQGGHEAELKHLATELGLAWTDTRTTSDSPSGVLSPWSVVFLGPQFGESKAACYQDCDAFVLPSFSEGMPMAVLEAWAYRKPVLMTAVCNLSEGFSAGAAIRIGTDAQGISNGLNELLQASQGDLATMGQRGRALVTEKFTWARIAGQMRGVYQWVLGGGEKPHCVI